MIGTKKLKIEGYIDVSWADDKTLENIQKLGLSGIGMVLEDIRRNPPISDNYKERQKRIYEAMNKPDYVGPSKPQLYPDIRWAINVELPNR